MISIKKFFLKHIVLILVFIVATLLLIQYYFSYKMVLELTKKRFYHLAKQATLTVKEKDTQAKEMLLLLAHSPLINSMDNFEKEKSLIELFATPMRNNNKIYASYIGYGNGNFFEIINAKNSPTIPSHYNAPKNTRWITVKVIKLKSKKLRVFDFYDKNLKHIKQRYDETTYNPLTRPWYQEAIRSNGPVRVGAYLFYNLQKMGITYSTALKNRKDVVAMDITLESLNEFLKSLKFSPDSQILMIENQDRLIAKSEDKNIKVDKEILNAIKNRDKNIISYSKDKISYLAMAVPILAEKDSTIWLTFRVKKSTMMSPYLKIIYTEIFVTIVILILLVPFVNKTSKRLLKPIYALTKENQKIKNREFDKIKKIDSEILELNQLSNSLVDMAKSIQNYQKRQEKLLEGFIHLIADTIDAKSPYTGEHCKRVPILAKMLIKEADRAKDGSLKDFKIKNKEILKGIEWSAWLHDCGKLVVPDYIIDKATKLETVYNRIHEIRTRFEVLLRDAKIRYLEALLIGENPKKAKEEFEKEKAKLQSDFEFIAKINLGQEPLSEDDCKRLKQISKIEWERNFSKLLGISWKEKELLKEEDKLPAKERLITDGKEFQIKRSQKDLELFKKEQVKMDIPTLLYNKGELYNLCIKQGTLTKEERFKIQEHAIHTLRILKELPWTSNLKELVEDAANHHEHLDGTGYPRALESKELSIPARVMAIADIFEALTASNRPYKRANTLSQALNIMAKMSKERKIDYELFKLFIEKKVYLKFAKGYLKKEQIDTQNIDEAKLIKEAKPS